MSFVVSNSRAGVTEKCTVRFRVTAGSSAVTRPSTEPRRGAEAPHSGLEPVVDVEVLDSERRCDDPNSVDPMERRHRSGSRGPRDRFGP